MPLDNKSKLLNNKRKNGTLLRAGEIYYSSASLYKYFGRNIYFEHLFNRRVNIRLDESFLF